MLKELSIRNFAIIDDIKIDFYPGMSIMTGETGAGKSIIIQAVNLLLGGRADSRMIRQGFDKAEIEAFFTVEEESPAALMMQERGLKADKGLSIKRIISNKSQNRIYINGGVSNSQVLGELSRQLASIAGQHLHHSLLDETIHLDILDRYARLEDKKLIYKDHFIKLNQAIKKLKSLKEKKEKTEKEADFILFQIEEIKNAALYEKEDEELIEERRKLRHFQDLSLIINELIEKLYERENSLSEEFSDVARKLERAAGLDKNLEEISRTAEKLALNCEDMAEQLRQYLEKMEKDPERLNHIEDRLFLIEKLKKKYGGTISSVLTYKDKLQTESQDSARLEEEITEVREKRELHYKESIRLARELSLKRAEAALKMAEEVESELDELCMKDTSFRIELLSLSPDSSAWLQDQGRGLSEDGAESARFCIRPNIGEAENPLSRVASGGELSRIVLAIKSIVARNETISSIIFDEADAGIGGTVAEAVGLKMKKLAAKQQVICITHLAQIAKFAQHHYHISKYTEKGRTHSSINLLSPEERTREIARMLSGSAISDTTLAHAEEMLKKAGTSID